LAREFFYRKNVGSINALSVQSLVLMVVTTAGKIKVTHTAAEQSATVVPMVGTGQFIGCEIIVFLVKITAVN
jgi:hypothetical protein